MEHNRQRQRRESTVNAESQLLSGPGGETMHLDPDVANDSRGKEGGEDHQTEGESVAGVGEVRSRLSSSA